MTTPSTDKEQVMCSEDNQKEVDRLIAKAQQGCVDRGVDPISGKRGKCHVFLDSDICECEDRIDLSKERMK